MSQAARFRIHLQTPGWAITASVEAPGEAATVESWLPLLQALAARVSEMARDAAAAAGQPVSCGKACGACCRQPVAISLVEAQALANLVAQMPPPRQGEIRRRFAEGRARLAQSGILAADYAAPDPAFPLAETPQQRLGAAWFSLQIACPFLEDESCSIYDERPLVCREHQVTSPAAACARLYREPVDRLDPPVRLAEALMRAAAKLAGVPAVTVPLLMSLDPREEVDAALARTRDPRELLETLLGEIGEWRIEPIDEA